MGDCGGGADPSSSLHTSSLYCTVVLYCNLLFSCSEGVALRALLAELSEVEGYWVCRIIPVMPCQKSLPRWNKHLVTFQQLHNAEQEDAVLSIPVLHIQMFPLVSFLTVRIKFCSRIGNGTAIVGEGERETTCHSVFAMLVQNATYCDAISYYQTPLGTQIVSPEPTN